MKLNEKSIYIAVAGSVLISAVAARELYVTGYLSNDCKVKPFSDVSSQWARIPETPVFENPTYSSEIVGSLKSESIRVTETRNGWRLVDIGGKEGWAPPEYEAYNSDETVTIDVPIEHQFPELYNGCEPVAVQMILEEYGIELDKVEFASSMPKDSTEPVFDSDTGEILIWGDPDVGFVGDVTGRNGIGYSINPAPLVEFLKSYGVTPVDLTGVSVQALERYIRAGHPVAVWVTVEFQDPGYRYWQTPAGKTISGTFHTHTMTLVGFDQDSYYLNDPYTGTKNYKISRERFVEIWTKMGKKALALE